MKRIFHAAILTLFAVVVFSAVLSGVGKVLSKFHFNFFERYFIPQDFWGYCFTGLLHLSVIYLIVIVSFSSYAKTFTYGKDDNLE